MKVRILSAVSLLACVISCVETNYKLGSNLVPDSQKYLIVPENEFPVNLKSACPDSLSGYSSTRFVVGSVNDGDFGICERSSAITLVPMYDTLDFGTDPKVNRFHFNATVDTVSAPDETSLHMLQTLGVYELASRIDADYTYSSDAEVVFVDDDPTPEQIATGKVFVRNGLVSNTLPVVNGKDSLSFDFTRAFAEKFLSITQDDLSDIKKYTRKFPGIYFNTKRQATKGGRINLFDLQLGFNKDSWLLTGSFAELSITSTYSGQKKDTTFYFYFSPTGFYDVDSLLTNSATGSFPQYCLNIGKQDKQREKELSEDTRKVYAEGGGSGLKPYVSALELRDRVRSVIASNGHNPDRAIITKASLVMPFVSGEPDFGDLDHFPVVLSPTVRIHAKYRNADTTFTRIEYAGIADASSSVENQGDINRSLMCYQPDVTYHVQSIVSMDTTSTSYKGLKKGEYDIWFLTMAYETIVTVTAADKELSDYYSMLAYQSYYGSMYGGGGGYGDYYSNYYSYMMAAMYAGNSSSSTSTTLQLDRDRYYRAVLSGPAADDAGIRPKFVFSYAVPKD